MLGPGSAQASTPSDLSGVLYDRSPYLIASSLFPLWKLELVWIYGVAMRVLGKIHYMQAP